jgi:hypothetical protein
MAKRRSAGRKLASPGTVGFIVPPFALSLDTAVATEASAQGTDVGTLTVNPPNSSITLLDSDGNKFQLNGNVLECGSVALNALTDGAASVQVRISLNTYIFERTFPITVNSVAVSAVALAGGHTVAHLAAAATVIGALSSTPSGATFSIVAQDIANGFAISGGNLVVGAGVLTAGTVNVTVRATRAGKTRDQAFAITVT